MAMANCFGVGIALGFERGAQVHALLVELTGRPCLCVGGRPCPFLPDPPQVADGAADTPALLLI